MNLPPDKEYILIQNGHYTFFLPQIATFIPDITTTWTAISSRIEVHQMTAY